MIMPFTGKATNPCLRSCKIDSGVFTLWIRCWRRYAPPSLIKIPCRSCTRFNRVPASLFLSKESATKVMPASSKYKPPLRQVMTFASIIPSNRGLVTGSCFVALVLFVFLPALVFLSVFPTMRILLWSRIKNGSTDQALSRESNKSSTVLSRPPSR